MGGESVRWLLAFACVQLIALGVSPAFACDCSVSPVDRALRSSPLVFSGTVTSVRLVRATNPSDVSATIVELALQRSYKGAPARTVTLHTQRPHSDCSGFEFVAGDQYLVFAIRNSGEVTQRYGLSPATVTYGVTSCGGTSNARDPMTRRREQRLAEMLLSSEPRPR